MPDFWIWSVSGGTPLNSETAHIALKGVASYKAIDSNAGIIKTNETYERPKYLDAPIK